MVSREGPPHVVRIVRDVGLSDEAVEVLVGEVHERVAAAIDVVERGDDEVLLLVRVDGRECLHEPRSTDRFGRRRVGAPSNIRRSVSQRDRHTTIQSSTTVVEYVP